MVLIKYNGIESEITVKDFKGLTAPAGLGYTVMTLTLSQTGTNVPNQDFMLNNTAGLPAPTYIYQSAGVYRVEFPTGTFPDLNKASVIHESSGGFDSQISAGSVLNNGANDLFTIYSRTGNASALADARLVSTLFEIRVYD